MITKLKKVYYCEFCKKKKGLSASSMAQHERKCTMNPNRHCNMCSKILVITKRDKEEIKVVDGDSYTFEDYCGKLSAWHSGCPVCVFSIIRQYGIPYMNKQDKFYGYYPLKEKIDEYWEEERMAEERGSIY